MSNASAAANSRTDTAKDAAFGTKDDGSAFNNAITANVSSNSEAEKLAKQDQAKRADDNATASGLRNDRLLSAVRALLKALYGVERDTDAEAAARDQMIKDGDELTDDNAPETRLKKLEAKRAKDARDAGMSPASGPDPILPLVLAARAGSVTEDDDVSGIAKDVSHTKEIIQIVRALIDAFAK